MEAVTNLYFIWASSQESLFSRFFHQVRLKPVCSTKEASYSHEIANIEISYIILYYLGSEQQRRWSDCADAQADLCSCCSHMS